MERFHFPLLVSNIFLEEIRPTEKLDFKLDKFVEQETQHYLGYQVLGK